MSECSHDCSSCSQNCSERKIEKEKQNDNSIVKKVIGIVSGKGGVGKSLVTSILSVLTRKKGQTTLKLPRVEGQHHEERPCLWSGVQ